MSKDLFCRLIRNTVTSMVAILHASSSCQEQMYPSKIEIRAVAEKIVDYYPMLQDSNMPYLTVYSKMYKRVQNIKSPRKRQRRVPQRGVPKRSLLESSLEDDIDASTNLSVASTVILPNSDDSNAELSQVQVHRFWTWSSRPGGPRQPRLWMHPCFRDPRHAVDELGRILGCANSKYIDDTKKRWQTFCTNVQFYGLSKKVLKPPIPVDMGGVGPRGQAGPYRFICSHLK
ncbi:unnamed protein product [Boreogadus saida]